MASSIVYRSKTGSCKRYAELLSAALHLPAYPDGKAPLRSGGEVIYVSWALAGKAVGLKKALKNYDLAGVVLVGMSPVYPDSVEKARAANGLGDWMPFFVLQGGFDMARLSGPMKLIMKVKCREIAAGLERKKDQLSPAEQALYTMAATGRGEPPVWDASEIVRHYLPDGGGLHQAR